MPLQTIAAGKTLIIRSLTLKVCIVPSKSGGRSRFSEWSLCLRVPAPRAKLGLCAPRQVISVRLRRQWRRKKHDREIGKNLVSGGVEPGLRSGSTPRRLKRCRPTKTRSDVAKYENARA